jgi:aspartate carbamoyltransferase catalytic subunit
MSENSRFDGWPHVIYSQQFSRKWIEDAFFPRSREMKQVFQKRGSNLLKGKRMLALFFRPSTRTRLSFQMAMSYLGGEVVFATDNAAEFSSATKGESDRHTSMVCACYRPDVVIVRHNKEGAAEIFAKNSFVPIINAGDGPGQHPTQALLDIFTIQEKFGHIDDISIVISGDLANNRAARSLAYLLSKFKNIRIYFVSPLQQRMKQDVLTYLTEKGVWFQEGENLQDVISIADVVYMLRTQREHGSAIFDLTDNTVLDEAKAQLAKPSAIFMHPLPIDSRVQEIKPEVEKDSRSVFLTDQVESGMFTRMALLTMVIENHQKRSLGRRFGSWLANRRARGKRA